LPPLALLKDEPLSNLDNEPRDDLRGYLLDLHSQLGFTLLYVTQCKEKIGRIGTRAILLPDGKGVSA
jgi:ABC-type sugar transport system ATPase subunit